MKQSINWNAVAAIGQAISSIAVVLTLVYLTNQLRQAEAASTDANRLARANGVTAFYLAAAHDREFRSTQNLIVEGTFGARFTEELGRRLDLTEDQTTQLSATAHYWFWLHWGQWRSSMDERDLTELRNMVERFYALPQIRAVWEAQRSWMDPAFVDFVDEALSAARPPLPGEQEAALEALRHKLDGLGIGIPFEAADRHR